MSNELTKRRRQCRGDVAEKFAPVSVGVSRLPVCPAPMLWERESGCLTSAVSSELSGYRIKGREKKKRQEALKVPAFKRGNVSLRLLQFQLPCPSVTVPTFPPFLRGFFPSPQTLSLVGSVPSSAWN